MSEANKPNRRVKIVFEEVEMDQEDLTGCKVYLEFEGRTVTHEILEGDEWTVPEYWATHVFDQIVGEMMEKGIPNVRLENPEDMN